MGGRINKVSTPCPQLVRKRGVAPTYPASVEESATIDWRLLLQQMAPPFIIHTKLDVDRRVSTHPAQSESEKPSIGLSAGFMATPRE